MKVLWSVVAALAVCVFAVHADTNTFARYQSIVDRLPFGPEPEGFDPTKPPSEQSAGGAAGGEVGADGLTEEQRLAEAQKALGAVRVSVFNVTPGGQIAVGFTDSSAKPEVNYYLYVGQERNGWKVVSAENGEEKSVTLAKDGAEATLKLGEGTTGGGKGSPAKAGAPGRPMARAPGVPPPAIPNATAPTGASTLSPLGRLRERRMMRQRQAEEDRAAQAKAAEERKAREAAEEERKAQEAEERAQQRQQLQAMADELRKQREAREAEKAKEKEKAESEGGGDE